MHDLKGWVYEKLGDLPILFIDSDRSKRYPKRSEFQDQGIAFLNAESISSGRFDRTKVNHIPYEKYEEIKKGRVENGDIVLTMRGNGVGDAALIFGEGILGLINAQMLILRPNDETINSKFLYYGFISPQFKCELSNFVSGSAQPQLTMTHLRHVPFRVPPLAEQKAIAHILGSLDDKIELNRQMNETLEAMAQTLFKSWFVDFDPVIDNALAAGNAIPDEFAERAEQRKTIEKKDNADIQKLFPDAFEFTEEVGWIPLGWDVDGFKNIVEKYIDNRGKTPPLSEFGIPLIEVKHISDYEIKPSLDTTKFVDRDTYNSWFRSYLQTDDIIISTVGTIGRICMVANGEEFAIAQNLLGFRFKKTSVLPSFMYYQMDGFRFRHDVDARLVTTVQASIKRKDLETISLLIPSIKVQKAFEIIVKPLMNKQNSNQNIQLAKLRDILLPKLMSGELRIPDAEVLVENV